MKICSKCNIPQEDEQFNKKRGKLSSDCKTCHRKYTRQHYQQNKEYYADKRGNHQRKTRQLVDDYKETLFCTYCKLPFKGQPYLCDFHHITGDKDFNPATKKGTSIRLFLLEVAKCIPLCANCHRREHHGSVA